MVPIKPWNKLCGKGEHGLDPAAWHMTKVRPKAEVIGDAKKRRIKPGRLHFGSLMELCFVKGSELLEKANS